MNPVRGLIILALTATVAFGLLSPGLSRRTEAGSLVVTTTDDSGAGSLRQALADAGVNPGADVITFDPTTFPAGNPATVIATDAYTVTGDAAGQPLTIDGTGAGVIIQGQQATDTEALLYFQRTGTISGITLKNFVLQGSVAQADRGGEGIEFSATDISDVLIQDVRLVNNEGNGLQIKASGAISNVTVQDSEMSSNGFHGLAIGAASLDNVIVANNDASENDAVGIDIKADSSPSPATVIVRENIAALNERDGIGLFSESGTPTLHVTITRNTTSENGGLGINLGAAGDPPNGITTNDPDDDDSGINNLLNFPVFTGAGPAGIDGTACPGCTVELFSSDGDNTHGEGEDFLQATIADVNGNFHFSGCGQRAGETLTATATDAAGNTSEFAQNITVENPSTCVLKNGDNDCDNDVDGRDALLSVVHASGANDLGQQPDCPDLGDSLQATGVSASGVTGPGVFGDVNCDTLLDAGDALTLLQHVSSVALDPAPPGTCVPIGEPLPD